MLRAYRPDWPTTSLWAPVVGVVATSQLKVGLEEPWSGSDASLALTSLVLAAPLLGRRRDPVLAAAAVGVALSVQQGLGGALSFGSFVAVLVAACAGGRHATWTRAVVVAVTLMIGVVVANRDHLPEAGAELVFPAFYIAASTVLGAAVRRQGMQAAALAEANRALARERDAAARWATATERLRLARELHDSVAHTLTVTVVQAERCEQALSGDPVAVREAARAIQEAGRQGLRELRATVRVLREDGPGTGTSLADVQRLADSASIEVDLEVVGDPTTVSPEVSHEVFRIAQESLTNVVKHSGAVAASIRLRIDGVVDLEVTDPGPRRTAGLPAGGGTAWPA